MKKCKCVICGKEVKTSNCVPLSISYNIPDTGLYMTLNTYCKECNEKIVYPTLAIISDKLALGFDIKM